MKPASGSDRGPARAVSALLRRFTDLGHRQLRHCADDDLYPGGAAAPVDKLAEQLLYERWLKRDSWRLRDEVLPLLAGIDPVRWQGLEPDEDLTAAATALAQALRDGLSVDSDRDALAPAAVYQWAHREGLSLPSAFEQLMQFIQTTVKRDEADAPALKASDTGAAAPDGEHMLGAALYVLAKWPERCRDQYGNISPERIVDMIQTHATLWFETRRPALDRGTAIALIERWLA